MATIRKTSRLCPQPQRLIVPTDPAVLAYTAAMIDGEGYITFTHSNESWRVGIVNTDLGLMEWLIKQWPGSEFGQRKTPHGLGHLTCYTWLVRRRRDLWVLLRAVRPYMVIKTGRLDAALADIEPRLPRVLTDDPVIPAAGTPA